MIVGVTGGKSYISIKTLAVLRRQAFRVWATATGAALAWVVLIVAAPLLKSAGNWEISESIFEFFSYLCHQLPARSLKIQSESLAVCSRCFGVYFGLLAGAALYPLMRPIDQIDPLPRIWLFIALIPIVIDWSLGVFGVWENTHASRFVTGMLLGGVCAVYIISALIEIVRNLTLRRTLKKAA